MIVFFSNKFPEIEIIEFTKNHHRKRYAEKKDYLLKLYKKKNVEIFIYNFEFTGDIIKEPFQKVNGNLLKKLSQIIPFAYEKISILYELTDLFYRNFPEKKHFILSDTGFFSTLPEYVSNYALPYEFVKKKIKRYGVSGLLHQWVYEKTNKTSNKKGNKVISVYLSDFPNICTIKNGKAIESSVGFTPVEGLPSIKTVGELDSQIIFFLYVCGFTMNEIHEILTSKSGFSSILGKNCDIDDVVKNKKTRDILRYYILKHIGAYIGILNGIDRIIFSGKKNNLILDFIKYCCEEMNFIEIKIKDKIRQGEDIFYLTDKESDVEVCFIKENRMEMIKYYIEEIKKEE
ncbi:MAG TPA: hypothetical protein PKV21_06505 [bacterium]|nr:hypothetical protein [bacterium]HOM27140.1 hypothetical protein [bacterium]